MDSGIPSYPEWRPRSQECANAGTIRLLASAAFTLSLQNAILPPPLANVDDLDKAAALSSWKFLSHAEEPTEQSRGIQKALDGPVASVAQSDLLSRAESSIDQARLLSACVKHSGDWLHAPPISRGTTTQ